MSDARLAALRAQYPLPPASPGDEWRPHIPLRVTSRVFRHRSGSGPERAFVVDPLFPRVLEGTADTSGLDEGSADLIYGLVRGLAPRVVLETGTHKGRSTRSIATALQANAEIELQPRSYTAHLTPGHLWTVDAEDHGIFTSGAIPPNIQKYVTPIIGFTPDVLMEEPLASLTGIEFAFLDGDHSAEGLDAELHYVDQHRAAECWVAVDNSRDDYWKGVSQTLSSWKKYPRISLATCTGLDLIWMNGA